MFTKTDKVRIPAKVSEIISALRERGFEAYAVGGCVRDSILGRIPMDWDITTSALPGQVKEIFDHTVDTGIAHGTVTVLCKGEAFEVTTFRIDGKYEDSRHPSSVTFTPSLREDLKRRDFTINAMACSDQEGLIDLYGGMVDLREKIIRCVGDPYDRFTEDALRIMRAVRFAAQLDFEIDPGTALAARELAPALNKISAERIRDELVKLLISDHPQRMWTLCRLGMTAVILPEFDAAFEQPQNGPHHSVDVGTHTLLTLEKVRPDKTLRLAALLHDLAKPAVGKMGNDGIWRFPDHAREGAALAEKILKRLKFDNETVRRVTTLVRYHSFYPEATPAGIRKAAAMIGEDIFEDYLALKRADIAAQRPESTAERSRLIDSAGRLYEQIMERGDCLNLKGLALTGQDLLEDGMKKGPGIGYVLGELLEAVLEDPAINEKNILLAKSREIRIGNHQKDA